MRRQFGLVIAMFTLTALVVGIVGVAAVEASKKKGSDGCTPGFWKQDQRFGAWTAPYTPDTLFSAVFRGAFPGKTLLDVLQPQNAGPNVKLNALGRHTVAALLNTASPDVDYAYTNPQTVIDAFNAVFPGSDSSYLALKDVFAGFNKLACPL